MLDLALIISIHIIHVIPAAFYWLVIKSHAGQVVCSESHSECTETPAPPHHTEPGIHMAAPYTVSQLLLLRSKTDNK